MALVKMLWSSNYFMNNVFTCDNKYSRNTLMIYRCSEFWPTYTYSRIYFSWITMPSSPNIKAICERNLWNIKVDIMCAPPFKVVNIITRVTSSKNAVFNVLKKYFPGIWPSYKQLDIGTGIFLISNIVCHSFITNLKKNFYCCNWDRCTSLNYQIDDHVIYGRY